MENKSLRAGLIAGSVAMPLWAIFVYFAPAFSNLMVYVMLATAAVFITFTVLALIAARRGMPAKSSRRLLIATAPTVAFYVLGNFGLFDGLTVWQYLALDKYAPIPSQGIIAAILILFAFVTSVIQVRKYKGVTEVKAEVAVQPKKEKGATTEVNTPQGFRGFFGALLDPNLDRFISRIVSGILYSIIAWALIAATVVLEIYLIINLFPFDDHNFLLILVEIVLLPVASFLALIIVRMAFEAGIALIVVAENTKK